MTDLDRALEWAREVVAQWYPEERIAIVARALLAEHEQRVRWEREANNYREAMGNLASILREMLADQQRT